MCIIVLDGSVDVHTKRPDGGSEIVESLTTGAVLNSLALVSESFDLSRDLRIYPLEYGEAVTRAEVSSPSALVLTLSQAIFAQTANHYVKALRRRRNAPVDTPRPFSSPIDRLQALARARAKLLSVSGLRATHAMPSKFDESHLRELVAKASTLALAEAGEVLFSHDSSPAAASTPTGRAGRRGGASPPTSPGKSKAGSPPGSPPASPGWSGSPGRSKAKGRRGKDRVLPNSQSDSKPAVAPPGTCIYFVLQGELSVTRSTSEGLRAPEGATATTLHEGDVFSSPLPFGIASSAVDLPPAVTRCVSATSSSSAVVLCFDLTEVLDELLNATNAMSRRQAEQEKAIKAAKAREAIKEQCAAVRRRANELELKLGLRLQRDPRALWSWALRRVLTLMAFRIQPRAGAKGPPLGDAAGSLDDRLALLQKRVAQLEKIATERAKRVKLAVEEWEGLMPLMLPDEAAITLDTGQVDLTLVRVVQAETALAKLRESRQAQRGRYLQQLEAVEEETRADVLSRAPGLDHHSMSVLAKACKEFAGSLAEPMVQLQTKLRALWEELRIPDAARRKYEWSLGQPLAQEQVDEWRREDALEDAMDDEAEAA